jgi:hypothetical protein
MAGAIHPAMLIFGRCRQRARSAYERPRRQIAILVMAVTRAANVGCKFQTAVDETIIMEK